MTRVWLCLKPHNLTTVGTLYEVAWVFWVYNGYEAVCCIVFKMYGKWKKNLIKIIRIGFSLCPIYNVSWPVNAMKSYQFFFRITNSFIGQIFRLAIIILVFVTLQANDMKFSISSCILRLYTQIVIGTKNRMNLVYCYMHFYCHVVHILFIDKMYISSKNFI